MRTAVNQIASVVDPTAACLALFGAGLVVGGFLLPGSQSAATTSLFVLGSGFVAVAALLSRIREFEVGPAGIKATMVGKPAALPVVDIDADALNRVAYLATGDRVQAREAVEEALARARQQPKRLSSQQRDAYLVRTLVALLETAFERRWLHGQESEGAASRGAAAASTEGSTAVQVLQHLPFAIRIPWLLKALLGLRDEDIAGLLDRSVEDVSKDVAAARVALRPYFDDSVSSHA